MVARKYAESMYDGVCDIYEYNSVKRTNGSTTHEEQKVHNGVKCRLSHKTVDTVDQNENGGKLIQKIVVYLSPDIEVKAGSKMVITQAGKTAEYITSGLPAVYFSHQEIVLDIFRGWA